MKDFGSDSRNKSITWGKADKRLIKKGWIDIDGIDPLTSLFRSEKTFESIYTSLQDFIKL